VQHAAIVGERFVLVVAPGWTVRLHSGRLATALVDRTLDRVLGGRLTRWAYQGNRSLTRVDGRNRYLRRRHLNAGQAAVVAAMLEPMYAEATKVAETERKSKFPNSDSTRADRPESHIDEHPSRTKAAAVAGASGRTTGRAKRILNQAPDLVPAIMAGELSLDEAEKVLGSRRKDEPEKPPATPPTTPTLLTLRTVSCGRHRHEDGVASRGHRVRVR
jgi:hypothetical protein